MTLFLLLAVAGTLLAVALVARPLWRRRKEAGTGAPAVAIVVLMPVAVFLAYGLSSNYDWRSPPQPMNPDRTVGEAVLQLEEHLKARPADADGWRMLGQAYLNLERPEEAVRAYQRALDLSGGIDTEARLGRAEAEIFADPASLAGRAGEDIEAVLLLEPTNPRALWYGGLLAMARQDTALARERWTRLIDLDPPESVRTLLERQVALLAAEAGEEGTTVSAAPALPPAPTTPGVASPALRVSVSLDEALAERVAPGAPLFVFVRAAGGAGPPLAVVRESSSGLPLTVRISDEDVMIPGRTLLSSGNAEIVARISNRGDAVAAPGDLYGEATAAVGGDGEVAIDLRIDRVVPP